MTIPWFKLLKTVVIVFSIGGLTTFAYLQHPLFGALPQDERLERVMRSPHYADGVFRNEIDTPMLTTDQSEWSMWMETVFAEKGNPRPPGVVPAVKTNLIALDPTVDLVVWLGHSSYFVQIAGQRILIDPVFSSNAAPLPWVVSAFDGTNLYSVADLPPIDVLLVSHDHYDHLDYTSVKSLRPMVKQVIAGLGMGAHFEAWGYDPSIVREVDWGDLAGEFSGVKVYATPARHFSGRTFTRDQSLWVGFALVSSERRLYFSGDSGYGPHFKKIGEQLGPFDWVALDMGQYDVRWANVHMNPEQAAQAATDLGAKVLMPAHVGRFSISRHDWDDPFKRIEVASRQHEYALWTPMIGQPAYFDGRRQEFFSWWKMAGSN